MQRQVWDQDTISNYTAAGYWDDQSLGDRLAELARSDPGGTAFIDASESSTCSVSWADYHSAATRLSGVLARYPSERPVAVLMSDCWLLHAAYMAAEYAGVVAVGIGPRAGDREIAHILRSTGADRIITTRAHRGRDTSTLVSGLTSLGVDLDGHFVVDGMGAEDLAVELAGQPVRLPTLAEAEQPTRGCRVGPNDLFFINSTSGTTGLPKCVMHTQNRWKFFHKQCIQFDPSDVFLVAVPGPFGFGLWMSHVSPLMLGAPTVLVDEFSVDHVIEVMESCNVTVLAAVTSQVLMMLTSPALAEHDISSLRIIQTGGERVPFQRSVELEQATGAHVLQFYGSNESGCLSRTEISQTAAQRLRTAGRVIPEMNVRVFDDDGNEVTATGAPGRCACKGPAMSPGYFDNAEGNAELFRPDGWMYLGDIVTIDGDGYLTVEGRVADFIIRGGHNISAGAVEEEVLSHPRVTEVAAVAMPDETLGERVCAFVVTTDGVDLSLEDLTSHLAARAVSKNMWPERVVTVASLPRGSGGKIAKSELRERLALERQ